MARPVGCLCPIGVDDDVAEKRSGASSRSAVSQWPGLQSKAANGELTPLPSTVGTVQEPCQYLVQLKLESDPHPATNLATGHSAAYRVLR